MRALSESQTRIDLLTDEQDIAEVAKFAAKFSYRLQMAPAVDNGFWEALLTRTAETDLRDDLAHLVYLTAMTDRMSVEKVLDTVRDRLANFHHIELDVPPSDQAGIAEKHPDGH
ncbi:hypothetical protein [Arthrobacter sp. TMN-50]